MAMQVRGENRQEDGRRAWLGAHGGGPLVNCTLIDISAAGAKLAIAEADQIPETFSLWLSRQGQPRYACRVVWRSSNAIGVTFESG